MTVSALALAKLPWWPAGPSTTFRRTAHRPRSRADRRFDWATFGLALAIAAYMAIAYTPQHPDFAGRGPHWLQRLDLAIYVGSCGLLWLRRRWPLTITVLAVLPMTVTRVNEVVFVILLGTVVQYRAPRMGALLVAFTAGAVLLQDRLRNPQPESLRDTAVNVALEFGALLACSLYLRSRQQLIATLRDRAKLLERDQQLILEQARQRERTRIAQELHDVLGNRLALIGLHAGALEYRPDALPEQVTTTAGVIRASIRSAMVELRSVIGLLQVDGGSPGLADTPQPRLADLDRLAAEAKAAGIRLTWSNTVHGADEAPLPLGLAAYRIVQESLTNACKHAPGRPVRASVTGAAGDAVNIDIMNPTDPATGPPAAVPPRAGGGLFGIGERVALCGGQLQIGHTGLGEFRVRARLPWPRE